MCTGFSLKKTSTVSLSVDVRITIISGVVYLLRIFKMFHGLMNNPVQFGAMQRDPAFLLSNVDCHSAQSSQTMYEG